MIEKKFSEEILIKHFLQSPESLDRNNINLGDFYKSNNKFEIYNQLKKLKIVPFGAHILSKEEFDKDYWFEIHNSFEKRNIKICNILEDVFFTLEQKGVTSVCLYENFGVVLRSGACIGCFSSGDVDLTASYHDKEMIDDALNDCGFKEIIRRNKRNSKVMVSYYNPDVNEGGFWINVSWEPIARRYVHHNNKLSTRLNDARNTAEYVKDYHIKVLNTDELMYFSILHIALGHYYTISPRFRLYVDIDRLARNCEINWNNIFRWSNEDNMGIRVAVVLSICKELLNTPIPQNEVSMMSKNKNFLKLINFLYNPSIGDYYQRNGRLDKIYIDLISDGVHPFLAITDRILNIGNMGGSH